MFEADPPLPPRRGAGRARVALVGLGVIALVGGGWWLLRDSAPRPLDALAVPRDGPSATAAQSTATRATALAPDGEPADVEVCSPTPEQPPAGGCRITATLRQQPIPRDPTGSASARVLPNAPAFSPPLGFGLPTVLEAADPTVLVDGVTYFLFTSAGHLLNAPVTAIAPSDIEPMSNGLPGLAIRGAQGAEGSKPAQIDAMPEVPAWVAGPGVASPTVERLGSRYVMFFSAIRPEAPDPANLECVGRAVAVRPEGPYVPDPEPFTCGLADEHGAFDPDIFRDPRDGRVYLHVTFGGSSTPLWTIPLTRDGDAAGPPTALLRMQQPWERWFLQSPAMFYDGEDFVLAYSSGDPRTAAVSTGLARCSSPTGPCTSSSAGPWLTSRDRVAGPSGLDVFADVGGELVAVHHAFVAGEETMPGAPRHTYLRRMVVEDGLVELA